MTDLGSKQTVQVLEDLKVLIVDDNVDNATFLSYLLQSVGVKVATVNCALQALQVLDQFQPQVLISDIAMPLVDGYSLIKRIRSGSSKTKDILAIAVTAMHGEEVFEQALESGFHACLPAPFEFEELTQLLVSMHTQRKIHRGRQCGN